MWMIPKDQHGPRYLMDLLEVQLNASRFTARLDLDTHRKTQRGVKITCVRLRNKKDYCGEHPGPCFAGGRHTTSRYLEGLDWIGFNGMINDMLDKLSADCHVFSFNRESLVSKYYVRKGRRRRVAYPFSYRGQFAHWTQSDHDFEDYCGKPPPLLGPAVLDQGTPGLACHTPEAETLLKAEYGEDNH